MFFPVTTRVWDDFNEHVLNATIFFFFSIVIFMAVQAWDPSRFKKKKKETEITRPRERVSSSPKTGN